MAAGGGTSGRPHVFLFHLLSSRKRFILGAEVKDCWRNTRCFSGSFLTLFVLPGEFNVREFERNHMMFLKYRKLFFCSGFFDLQHRRSHVKLQLRFLTVKTFRQSFQTLMASHSRSTGRHRSSSLAESQRQKAETGKSDIFLNTFCWDLKCSFAS